MVIMKYFVKYSYLISSLLLALLLYVFWAVRFPYMAAYQEQLQMFLFDSEYFWERASVPGGIVRYVAEFTVQFGNKAFYGGIAFSILTLAYQLLTWCCIRKNGADNVAYVLSLLPMTLVMVFFCDENVSATLFVAIIIAMLAIIIYRALNGSVASIVFSVISVPVLYWLAGPAVFVFVLYAAYYELAVGKRYALPVILLVLAVGSLYGSSYLVSYSITRLWLGINFYKVIDTLPYMQIVLMMIPAVLAFIMHWMPKTDEKLNAKVMAGVQIAMVVLLVMVIVPKNLDKTKLVVMEADYLVRNQQWDKIISDAEKSSPDTPLTVAALNLALAMKGQQNERAFHFYQNGWQGAFPTFNKSSETSIFLAEIYYYIGMVNFTQLFAFEAQEAIPDNNKSARLFKRLAEANLINGQYEVARKYLQMLRKTFFYSDWAKSTMALLGNEEAINNHQTYGYLRKVRLGRDFLYSEREIDKMMGQLMMHSKDNYVAAQYLLLLPKLEGNERKFVAYREFLQRALRGETFEGNDSTNAHDDMAVGVDDAVQVDGRTGATHTVN